MKKFTQFKPVYKKINEDVQDGEMPKANLPEQTQEQPAKSDISKFISKLLESREMAQVYHWTVKGDMGSHAAHLALETYYSGVIEFIDDIVEIYQGQYGLIEGYETIDTSDSKSKDKLDYFKETVEFVKKERTCIKSEDTHIHNIIDELIALQYKTIYKLTYNK
jgi:DNA-binding ferritin-like protein